MFFGCAFAVMTCSAVFIGACSMYPGSAAIIGIYGKYRISMAAFALWFFTVIQIQTGMVSAP